MSNLKYKVGDRVRIKSLDWWNNNNDNNINESVRYVKCKNWNFVADMKKYCGKILTIEEVHKELNRYKMSEDNNLYSWTDEMIEGLVEEENKSNIIEEAKTYWDSTKDAWICPEGYIFKDENGNVINATKIVLEKKKKEYPKTYEECCELLDSCSYNIMFDRCETSYEEFLHNKLLALRRLIICRDAYWKLYGEEMGLGKPWEPDTYQIVYSIGRDSNKIGFCNDMFGGYFILEFPTREMRDAFKDNFDPDIEICKELL